MNERLFTLDQVAERWQVSKGLLYRMTEDGRLDRVKIGKYVRIPQSAIEAFENQTNGNGDGQ
ncbi:MAG: helix-turn-helix domain-containing protein [Actinomycetota bacterium]|nr:helix-turn-helix domain-containing protein [Actinomycetota bacterium]